MRADDQALDNNTDLSVRLTYVKNFTFCNLFDVGRIGCVILPKV